MKEVSDEVQRVVAPAINQETVWSTDIMASIDSATVLMGARQSCENRSSPPSSAKDRNRLGEIGDDALAPLERQEGIWVNGNGTCDRVVTAGRHHVDKGGA